MGGGEPSLKQNVKNKNKTKKTEMSHYFNAEVGFTKVFSYFQWTQLVTRLTVVFTWSPVESFILMLLSVFASYKNRIKIEHFVVGWGWQDKGKT